ncbi:uncharacterized protein YndB with AHSA1/START domain [Paucibacter oligotrophus]|uniref:Uncharacterized protein YndB with AHSA1/START domain n=1 Tax=Roseateles oligotrophus TaxID=1769250 RepID=A0A840LA30_9BURK|nr:SRPBCC family protein [Roseateles oligotrophus]MBB4844976.1 uncharacterized protein YndB with AHSA1/START domain [Roseateles oligotrophus]
MLKKILLALVLLIAGLALYASSRPDSFRVERSIDIQASPEKVYALLDDFKQFGRWSPWEGIDPAMQREFSGAERGVGAVYGWKGNRDVGQGRMEILAAEPAAKLTIQLDFITPFEAHNTAEYRLQAIPGGTRMTWAMYGPANFMTKLMSVFASMDSMVGKDFEKGLAQLKAVAEKS